MMNAYFQSMHINIANESDEMNMKSEKEREIEEKPCIHFDKVK